MPYGQDDNIVRSGSLGGPFGASERPQSEHPTCPLWGRAKRIFPRAALSQSYWWDLYDRNVECLSTIYDRETCCAHSTYKFNTSCALHNSYKVMADGSSVNNLLASVLDDDSLDLGVRQQKVEDIMSSSWRRSQRDTDRKEFSFHKDLTRKYIVCGYAQSAKPHQLDKIKHIVEVGPVNVTGIVFQVLFNMFNRGVGVRSMCQHMLWYRT